MQIAGFSKLSLGAWQGHPSCLIFLGGCNYKCPWCNYVDFLENPSRIISKDIILKILKKEKENVNHCVVSGGEPTIHKELPDFLKSIKKMGYKIRLDTNGSNPEMLSKVIKKKLANFISLDIKAPKSKYGFLIGYPNESLNYLLDKVQKSIDLLKNSRIDYEFKTTVGTFLTPKEIWEIVHWIRPAKKFVLVNYEKKGVLSPEFQVFSPYDALELALLKEKISPYFDNCEVKEGSSFLFTL